MRAENYIKIEFPSRSVNEGFARAAAAAFAGESGRMIALERIEDVARAREPLFTTGGAERSGMGFTIMESFTDKLRVRSAPGRGTTVTMVRAIKPRQGD